MVPPDQHNRSRERSSLVAALLDLKFERQVTPILVRWVYLAALVVVAFGVLFALLWVWSFASWMGAAVWLAAPVVVGLGLVVLLVVRIACERVLASFHVTMGRTPSADHIPPRR
ncbi:hypothetical protein GCM10010191_90610 [Actinomadura vinacea]|uniref:DUF4282 domain-containing protein n=1 Tax=Actinomadura vinacea TaxID=115336 RepID=A0ABN3KDS8_9ACTN